MKRRFQRRHEEPETVLRFSPLAWLKLRLFLHAGETEVGFFGISDKEDLLNVQEIVAPKQHTTAISVHFDDVSVADYFEDCADKAIAPARCGRIWIHTHPGSSPSPSTVDEETFARVFGNCDWAIMAIVARGGDTYVRMSFSAGPSGTVRIPIEVDWENLPHELLANEGGLDKLFSGWMDEYGTHVFPEEWRPAAAPSPIPDANFSRSALFDRRDMLGELYDATFLDQRIEQLYLDSMREEAYS